MERTLLGPSFRLGRFFGVDVWIHWTLFVMILFFASQATMRGASLAHVLIFVVVAEILLFGSVLLHEFGHILAARHFGMPTSFVILTPIGGAAFVGHSQRPWEEFVVAIAGPLVNILLAILGTLAYVLLGGVFTWGLWIPLLDDRPFYFYYIVGQWHLTLLYQFVEIQIILFLFNMLVLAYPMDGGRVLRAILWHLYGVHRGTVYACRVAKVAAIGMGIFGFSLGDLFLAIIAFFVYFEADREEKLYTSTYFSVPYEHRYGPRTPSSPAAHSWEEDERALEERLDRILAKVDEVGLAGLTKEERDFLQKMSERYRRRGL